MPRDALVVGINQYQNLPRLTAAAKDAEGIANILETYGDFRVRRLPEIIDNHCPAVGQQTFVSAQDLENHLVRLLMPKGNHVPEAICFYFSGHGIQREIGIREGYLAASDTQPDVSNSGLSLSWLRRLIKHSPVRQILIILDCCHSGEFLAAKDEAWQSNDGTSYLFIAASREYEEAYESLDSDYSVLTQAVLSALTPHSSEGGRITSTDLVAAIANQLSDEIQQPLFEQGGSEIVITHQTDRALPQAESASLISRLKQYRRNFCPYRGYKPFEEKHTEYFFGRESLTQEILKTLKSKNICALTGASGSGKTSLLRSGIIPRLAAGKDIAGSDSWIVRCVQLGTQPIQALASAFTLAKQEGEIASQLAQAESLLYNAPNGLSELVTAALLNCPTADKFWLVLDQFESILVPTADPQAQQERQQIVNALLETLQAKSTVFGIIISLRSNAIEDLLAYPELLSLIENNQVLMKPMSYQDIRDVIEKPADKSGLELDPYLIHHLTLDLSGAPGELALLQMTLYELWQRRKHTDHDKGVAYLSLKSYINLGGVSQLIINQATAFYDSLSSKEQLVARRIFLALCAPGDGRLDQSRRVRKVELINAQYPANSINQLLQKLIDARLIVSNQRFSLQQEGHATGTTWKTYESETSNVQRWLVADWTPKSNASEATIELAHKSLITDWPILRQWLQNNRSLLRQQQEIEKRAWIWHDRGKQKCAEYLLGQQYLNDVNRLLQTNLSELSTLAQRFVQVSQRTITYQRWKNWGIAIVLPLSVIVGMTVSLVRHQVAVPQKIETTPSKIQSDIPSGALIHEKLAPDDD